MKKFLAFLCGAFLQVAVVCSANAITITNGSFESGLNGWSPAATTGSVVTVTQDTAFSGNVYHPTDGQNFAKMTADSSLLQMSLSWAAGDKIGFDWAFLAKDYLPYNDFAIFSILTQSPDSLVLTLADVSKVGNYGETGWNLYAYQFKTSGSGTIVFGCNNVIDEGLSSVLLVDNVTNNPVPEPGTMMLLGAGLLGLAVYGKRRKNA